MSAKIKLDLKFKNIPRYVKGIIYSAYNVIEEKYYIGQTRTHRRSRDKFIPFGTIGRWDEHLDEAKNPHLLCQSRLLNNAIRKYGKTSFVVKTVCECTIDELDDMEIKFVSQYNSLSPNGYNLTSGGQVKNRIVAPELRKRLSISGKKYFSQEGAKEKQSTIISKFYRKNIIERYSELDIDKIEVRPIKEGSSFNIIYLYVYTKNEDPRRVRIGGKHIEFEEALRKSKDISMKLLNGDESLLEISPLITNSGNQWAKYLKKAESLSSLEITKVRFTVHKHTKNDVVTTYIRAKGMKNWKDEVKIVFGGATLSLSDALKSACAFYTLLEYDLKNIVLSDDRLKKLWRDCQIAGNS